MQQAEKFPSKLKESLFFGLYLGDLQSSGLRLRRLGRKLTGGSAVEGPLVVLANFEALLLVPLFRPPPPRGKSNALSLTCLCFALNYFCLHRFYVEWSVLADSFKAYTSKLP